MTSIVAQEVSDTRLYIKAANGREVELFPVRIKAEFDRTFGTREQRYRTVNDWIKAEIVAALGREVADPGLLAIDFDDTSGRVTRSEWGGEPERLREGR